MSDERYFAGCAGKEAFEKRSLAARVLKRKERAGRGYGLVVYRCRYCSGWHLGRPNTKRGK